MNLLSHLLCKKMQFPCDINGVEVKASIFRKECCEDRCEVCKLFASSDHCIFNCPTIFNQETLYKWKEYCIHTLDNGQNIKEMKAKSGALANFTPKFNDSFVKYKLHYFQYRWLDLCRKLDYRAMGPNDLFIQTDYSAQPVLDSQDKLNSVGHGVCVLACWVVLHSPRDMYYENQLGERVPYTYYSCDHVRIVTPSTGKQKDQDWFLHCKSFEYLISHYKNLLPNLNKVIVWTDGAPNQYKNRFVFYWVANAIQNYGVTIVHRFGATAQFKGVHDKIGQIAKWIVK